MTSAFRPVHELAAEIAARRLSPVDLVDEYLEHSGDWNPGSTLSSRSTLPMAPGRRRRGQGNPRRPCGRPFARHSDRGQRPGGDKGEVAMGGSAAWRHRIAPHTATLMRKLMAAGMINLGKTHTVEFAYGGWGTNQHLGTPWNPWDNATHRAPGGSSSGSGVAVAARMAPWAIGTDTGGSVRIPAAWNGITGAEDHDRPDQYAGRPASQPDAGHAWADHARHRGAALLLTVLQGEDRGDRHTLGVHDVAPMSELRRGVRGLRLARLPVHERDGIDAEVLAVYDRSVDALGELGAEIVDVALPERFAELGAINGRIMSAEAYAALAELVDDNAQILDQDVRPRVRAGATISSRDYLVALAERERMKASFNAAIEGVDARPTPTAVIPPRRWLPSIRTRHPRCSRAGSTSSTWVRRRCRMASLRADCPPRCRSSAEPMPNLWRCESAMPIRPHMIGTCGFRRWPHRHCRLRREPCVCSGKPNCCSMMLTVQALTACTSIPDISGC